MENETEILYVCVFDADMDMMVGYPSRSKLGPACERLAHTMNDRLRNGDKRSWSKDAYVFHNLKQDGRIYISVANADSKLRIVYDCLDSIAKARVEMTPKSRARSLLKKQMQAFNDPRSDEIAAAKQKLDQVRDVMVDNLDKVLTNVANLEEIDSKAIALEEESGDRGGWRETAGRVRREGCKKNLIISLVVLVAMLILVGIIALAIVIAVLV